MDIAIYTLTSTLHDEQTVEKRTRSFLDAFGFDFDFCGDDFSTYGTHLVDLIFVRTGGTEALFKRILPKLKTCRRRCIYLLASDKSNSLPAAMEILSYLTANGMSGEILHGDSSYVAERIARNVREAKIRKRFEEGRLGVIGEPSDWLIASGANGDYDVRDLGVELLKIPMAELLAEYNRTCVTPCDFHSELPAVQAAIPDANRIYLALKSLVEKYHLQGFTIRCFDLLGEIHNTGCLALARLNADGIVAGCEGDVPAMLSMWLARVMFGVSSFQSNPASVNPKTGDVCLAHCTIPFDMLRHYVLDTHFESGIGVAVRGQVPEGPVTIFKMSCDGSRFFVAEGELLANGNDPELCRTQLVVHLADTHKAMYFLTHPIGNHHVLISGHHAAELEAFMHSISQSS